MIKQNKIKNTRTALGLISCFFVLVIGLLGFTISPFAEASYFFSTEQAANNILSEKSSPTPVKPNKQKTSSTPAEACSPLPTPLSEAAKNDPDRREHPFSENVDWDCDGICNEADNCILHYNPDQKDRDKDRKGDACDPKLVDLSFIDSRCDYDGDGVPDSKDNCPLVCNPEQGDVNENGIGDVCDTTFPNAIRGEKLCTKRIKVKKPEPPKPKVSGGK